jgi:uroporphyrinogen decarboxylase
MNMAPSSETLQPVKLDWQGFLSNIRREGTPERVYYFEHGIADNVLAAMADQFDLWRGLEGDEPVQDWRRREAAHAFIGQELFRVFPAQSRISIPKRHGEWVEEGQGAITTWEEFEKFPWPNPAQVDYSVFEYFDRHLNPEMRVFNVVEVWEVVVGLFGFESLCYALYEDRNLVDAMFQKAGEFALKVAETVCDFNCYGAVYLADDLAFKTSMFMDPKTLRELVLPWHKRIADVAHAKGKLFFLHCCGDMYPLIDDYIDDIKIDAKHSFEEAVVPVTEVKKRYGDRLTILGGMDVDFLARASQDKIAAKTREILEICHPGGGYFLGSGNWVTAYIPPENYLAMLKVGREYR